MNTLWLNLISDKTQKRKVIYPKKKNETKKKAPINPVLMKNLSLCSTMFTQPNLFAKNTLKMPHTHTHATHSVNLGLSFVANFSSGFLIEHIDPNLTDKFPFIYISQEFQSRSQVKDKTSLDELKEYRSNKKGAILVNFLLLLPSFSPSQISGQVILLICSENSGKTLIFSKFDFFETKVKIKIVHGPLWNTIYFPAHICLKTIFTCIINNFNNFVKRV